MDGTGVLKTAQVEVLPTSGLINITYVQTLLLNLLIYNQLFRVKLVSRCKNNPCAQESSSKDAQVKVVLGRGLDIIS